MPVAESRATLKILKGPNHGECFTLFAPATVLGRETGCDIILPLATVSRQHARIGRDAEGFYVEDLGSMNGTYVNGKRIAGPCRLQAGDHIQMDDFLLSFRQSAGDLAERLNESTVTEDKGPPLESAEVPRSTIMNQLSVLSGGDLRAEVNPHVKLQAVLEVIRNVGSSLEIDEVMQRILDSLFHIFPQADCGYVFLAGSRGSRLTPCAVKHRVCERNAHPTIGPISSHLAARVVAEGRGLLSVPLEGQGNGAADSVIDEPLRAVICAPLITPSGAFIGAIQLGSEDAGRQFIEKDLDVLASLGSLAGQLVEHSRLHERLQSEAVLAREHAAAQREGRRLRAVLDLLPVAVFIADAEGKITQSNAQALELWGGSAPLCQRPEEYADYYRAWWPGTERRVESHEFGMARALATGAASRDEEFEIEGLDGRRRTILGYASPIRDELDRIIGGVSVHVDITSRKEIERALADTNRRKDEFLAMLAHELRNPLAPLRNALALMGREHLDDETLDWARGVMDQQVDQLVRLVDDLLDLSRIAGGKIVIEPQTVELGQVVARAVETVGPLVIAYRHNLVVNIPDAPLWLQADPARLAQVLTNLLQNAIKYTEPEGQIHLDARRVDGEVEIQVRDTGVGIPADVLPRIFDLYAQGERSLGRSQGGLGIGLSLVQKLVELHGGRVTAFSEGPQKGSTFCVRLPLATSPGKVAPPQWRPTLVTPRRILVVDDQVGQAEVLAKLLVRFWRHDVAVAHDGRTALEAARNHRPEVVLLDIGLPDMSGYEVAQQMRRQPELKATLLVALTGYGQEEDRARALEAGFDVHLIKPVAAAKLEDIFQHPKLAAGA